MKIVILTALLVGGATVLGAVIGLIFKNISLKRSDLILSFCIGVMLCASVVGLIVPSYEYSGKYGIIITVVGVFTGAIFLDLLEILISRLDNTKREQNPLLLVIAIALHNLPEGLAAGICFGTGNTRHAILIAGGIAIQNIPEGMVTIQPMLLCGFSKKKAFLYSALTGIIEIIGTILGYLLLTVATVAMPFMLAFAGGTMLYVINHDMAQKGNSSKGSTYLYLLGFAIMLICDVIFK
jgi:ZIP family zinc transporter